MSYNEPNTPDDLPKLGSIRTYYPGATVYIEKFNFYHEMCVEMVKAVFQNQDHPGEEIELSGVPVRHQDMISYEKSGRPIFYSSVKPYTQIASDDLPGKYECRSVKVVTATGQEIPFEDPNNAIHWTLWVEEEPSTPPRFDV